MSAVKRIAVMTSGGDSPGLNAAVRAVVRVGLAHDLEVYGIRRGYEGLLRGDFHLMGSRDVSGILGTGGTILQTARCPEFRRLPAQQGPEGSSSSAYWVPYHLLPCHSCTS